MPVRRATLLVVTLFAAGCGGSAAESVVYSGYCTFGFETIEFTPTNSSEAWLVKGADPCPALKHVPGRAPHTVFVEVRGKLSPTGSYGLPMVDYPRELTVQQSLTCREISLVEVVPKTKVWNSVPGIK